MIYNPNKKGTIILSHYRSGGTRLLNTTWLCIGEKNTTNFSEWNHSLSNTEKENMIQVLPIQVNIYIHY